MKMSNHQLGKHVNFPAVVIIRQNIYLLWRMILLFSQIVWKPFELFIAFYQLKKKWTCQLWRLLGTSGWKFYVKLWNYKTYYLNHMLMYVPNRYIYLFTNQIGFKYILISGKDCDKRLYVIERHIDALNKRSK